MMMMMMMVMMMMQDEGGRMKQHGEKYGDGFVCDATERVVDVGRGSCDLSSF